MGSDQANQPVTGCLMDVKRFAVHDGPGIRTTLFLKGCSLKCIWCHNPEGIAAKPELAYYAHKCIGCGECVVACARGAHEMTANGHVFHRERCRACGACEAGCLGEALKLFGRPVTVAEALKIALEDRIFMEHSGGGVTLSGGEPLRQADFCFELLRALKAEQISTAVDTCGQVGWEAFAKVLPVTDLFLYDIKHIDSARHRALTGQGNELILDNLRRLSEAGARIEIRLPLVPGCNDDPATLAGIGRLLGGLRIEKMRVLPYHALARSKYQALGMPDTMPDASSPTDDDLNAAAAILQALGVPAVSGRA